MSLENEYLLYENSDNDENSTADMKHDTMGKSIDGSQDDSTVIIKLPFILGPCCRYLVGILIAILCTGSYFSYDSPGSMSKHLAEYPLEIENDKFMLLYSLYSWPNVIMSFIGGFLVDRVLGLRLGACIFIFLVSIGHALVVAGLFMNKFWIMCLGRFIFGLGGESLQVTQNSYVVKWFEKHGELNTVFGCMLSLARLGSSMSLIILPSIYKSLSKYHLSNTVKLGLTFSVALLFCCVCFIVSILLMHIDKKKEVAEKIFQKSVVKHTNGTYGTFDQDQTDTTENTKKIRIYDIKNFCLSFYLITLIIVLYYLAAFPFVSIASSFIQRKYEYDDITAGQIVGVIYIASGLISPFIGILIDKVGYNIYWVQFGIMLTLLVHILFCFTFTPPIIQMLIMSIGFSIVSSALWPMIAMTVDKNYLSTAFGLTQSAQNLGLAIFTIVIGYISKIFGYFLSEVIFVTVVCCALLVSLFLYIEDLKQGEQLNMSKKKHINIQIAKELINESTEIL
ncbi:Major facilitator superfamily domain-containing protein 1 [Intoshia linei]|uniref:Lysosomal dipeptide transporter MFSD1 n=1 Tax=Intoshia linei TaxID=1819745 RepID=A0A177BCF0_9BILA|nr:Major facilitator superfamily domain-containing protein 1 [Intoshia linei]